MSVDSRSGACSRRLPAHCFTRFKRRVAAKRQHCTKETVVAGAPCAVWPGLAGPRGRVVGRSAGRSAGRQWGGRGL